MLSVCISSVTHVNSSSLSSTIGKRFLYAYQHLERIGKLRHARFTNSNDLVPLVPFHGISRSYKHVGMHIRLLGVDKFAQYWLRRALDVTYPKYHDVSGVGSLDCCMIILWSLHKYHNVLTSIPYSCLSICSGGLKR